jgi:hypothetical protein
MATRILYLCALLCASSSIALRLERDDLLTFPDVGRLFLWIVAMGSLAVFLLSELLEIYLQAPGIIMTPGIQICNVP